MFCKIQQLNLLCPDLHFGVYLMDQGATKSRTIAECRWQRGSIFTIGCVLVCYLFD